VLISQKRCNSYNGNDRKWHVSYRMAPISMTLSDLECHFTVSEPFWLLIINDWIWRVLATLCVYMDVKVSAVFNRSCFPKMTDFSRLGALQAVTHTLKVVVSKKWREIDTLLLHTTNRKYHMAYIFVPFPMTLDDLEGHSPSAGLIKCNSANICATYSTVLAVTARRAVPRR